MKRVEASHTRHKPLCDEHSPSTTFPTDHRHYNPLRDEPPYIPLLVTQPVKWSKIAVLIPGRLGKQCRERWFNHLDPSLTKTVWTTREDEVLFNALVRTALFSVSKSGRFLLLVVCAFVIEVQAISVCGVCFCCRSTGCFCLWCICMIRMCFGFRSTRGFCW